MRYCLQWKRVLHPPVTLFISLQFIQLLCLKSCRSQEILEWEKCDLSEFDCVMDDGVRWSVLVFQEPLRLGLLNTTVSRVCTEMEMPCLWWRIESGLSSQEGCCNSNKWFWQPWWAAQKYQILSVLAKLCQKSEGNKKIKMGETNRKQLEREKVKTCNVYGPTKRI